MIWLTGDPGSDPSTLQAMIFVREFEARADRLVIEIGSVPLSHPHTRELLTELHDVRAQIQRLQTTYRLPLGRSVAEPAVPGEPMAFDQAG
ncbi:hypothetical protein [Gordonia sp. FQ]|uniref:hypothetical protein n=1 Tax=Gordonia sp. FQ TaxID=3446634 RepID=UPI003F85324C